LWNDFTTVLVHAQSSEESLPEKSARCILDEQEFEVQGNNKATLRIHRIFRIYNENGRKHGVFLEQQNKFIRAENIKGAVKDSNGTLVKKLQKDEIGETMLFPGYTLYSDEQTKYFELGTNTFPYDLDYSCEIKYKSLFFWPPWTPQREIPVDRSIYRLIVPLDFGFKLHKCNLQINPIESLTGGERKLVFELNDLPAFKPEDHMPPLQDHQLAVLFFPTAFDLDGYRGSADSWRQFGKWYDSVARPQYHLTPEQEEMVRQLVKDCISEKDTVKALYRFLQHKTRYIAIHLGVGGYQPHEASLVLHNGYGDCKDLSTLLIVMLGTVGIKAYPVLLETRDKGTVLADFPSSQFNHVICCVPLERDTFWLDGTCSYCSFGELPVWDEGCQALVVMGDTAAIVETPTSLAEENSINRILQAKLESDGSLDVTGIISATGNFETRYRQVLNSLDAKEKKEWLGRVIGRYTPSHTLISYDFESVSNPDIPFSIEFAAKLIQYPTKSGKDLLVNLNLLSRLDAEEIPKEKERKYPVDNQDVYTTEDKVTLEFPEVLTIGTIPEEQNIQSPYGSFKIRYLVDGNHITYKRIQTVTRRLVEPKEFEEFKEFLGRIYKIDHTFVVLTNKP
jgi:hypothetical protein